MFKNLYIDKGVIPNGLKQIVMTPIYKKDNSFIKTNHGQQVYYQFYQNYQFDFHAQKSKQCETDKNPQKLKPRK